MSGSVVAIHIARSEGGAMESQDSIAAIAGVGLAGDRYATHVGHYSDDSNGREVTLIEAEVLDDLAASGNVLPAGATRRNLTTRGVGLNDLVGRRFRIGDVECIGIRLCEPCTYMQGLVGQPVLAPLVHRGGLRADILVGGVIRVGDAIDALDESAVDRQPPALAAR